MRNVIAWTVWWVLFVAGLSLIGYACYLRFFVVSSDPFDPLRQTSINYLFAAAGLNLIGGALASLMRKP